MGKLYDAFGRLLSSSATRDVRAAIQAAALADEWATAQDIADREHMRSVCLKCAIKNATTAHYDNAGRPWRVCITCFHDLNPEPDVMGAGLMLQGLIKRDVQ